MTLVAFLITASTRDFKSFLEIFSELYVLTEATAFTSVASMSSNKGSFVAGDIIAFKSGETFPITSYFNPNSGDSGAENNHIVYTSFGTGAKPILNATAIYSGTWTDQTGNIWKSED